MERAQVLSNPQVREMSILKNVYVWMSAGLALTGVIALGVASNPVLVSRFIGNPVLFFGAIIGEFALVWYLSARIMTMSTRAATLGFAGYAALNGLTLSVILLAYTGQSVAQAFFVTAGTFAAMSLYAVTTRRDLSSWGSYLFMGIIGIIIASVVNMFLQSAMMSYLISYIGVGLFMALTAYDTQQIKRWNDSFGNGMNEAQYMKLSILGALKLYLDFINLFLFILRIFGGRRN
ncbi:MAG: Bax inhibitor-1/YccA family protein [Spirochaetales bacterium]|nr:Bax inhibitor-1/YccA family protein [Spirochaetales bacterium]